MDIAEAISGRRSVREYSDKPVGPDLIRDLVAAAIEAPSAMNEQPWTFTVVRNRTALDRVSDGAKAHLLTTMGDDPHMGQFRALFGDPKFQIFHHAPVLVVISAQAEGPWTVIDCALAAENLMLAAHAAGLGSCWIGFAQDYLNSSEGKALLEAPAECTPVAPIILGHPKGVHAPVPRHPPVVKWID